MNLFKYSVYRNDEYKCQNKKLDEERRFCMLAWARIQSVRIARMGRRLNTELKR